jgi:hypothetical protein
LRRLGIPVRFTGEARMKKSAIVPGAVLAVMMLVLVASTATASGVSLEVLNLPPDGLLELGVGESYTFDIAVDSDEPFILAIAVNDAYYPGRGIFWHGSDTAHHDTTALLHLTMVGKRSTADLAAVSDWPEPGDTWPEGVAPVSIVAGARFKRGVVFSERWNFAVRVP